jgi:hypothetical protein
MKRMQDGSANAEEKEKAAIQTVVWIQKALRLVETTSDTEYMKFLSLKVGVDILLYASARIAGSNLFYVV